MALDRITSFRNWIKYAKPRMSYVYHEGFLYVDRDRDSSGETSWIARFAYGQYKNGAIELVQKRISDGCYKYLAIKRRGR